MIKPIFYESADTELTSLYDEIKAALKTPILPNWVTYLGSQIGVLKSIWGSVRNLLIDGQLNPLLQELIIFSVSRQNGSSYCAQFHGTNALHICPTLSYQDLLDLSEGRSTGVIPDAYEKVVKVAVNHAQQTCPLSPEVMQELDELGFSNEQVLEILAIVGLALMFNVYTIGANIPIDESHQIRQIA